MNADDISRLQRPCSPGFVRWMRATFSVLALLCVLGACGHGSRPAPRTCEAGVVVITHGDTIWKVSEKTVEGYSIGYKFSYFGVFWVDLWTSGGTFCLFKGDRYSEITEAKAAEYAGENVAVPFLYRYPLGWLLFGGMVVLGVAGSLLGRRKTAAVAQDLQRALEIVVNNADMDPAKSEDARRESLTKAIDAGVAHLVGRGIAEPKARELLLGMLQQSGTAAATT